VGLYPCRYPVTGGAAFRQKKLEETFKRISVFIAATAVFSSIAGWYFKN
jgi:hypothetical protein